MINRNMLIIVGVVLVAVAAIAVFGAGMNRPQASVTDFESCADAGYPVMESFPMQCRGPDGTLYVQEIEQNGTTDGTISNDTVVYFRDQLWQRAVENNGGMMPIEGFDPDLYMAAYPGLEKSDFHNVAAIGGVWTYDAATDALEFGPEPRYTITSADGTINDEGMPTLLDNIAGRLNITVTGNSSVDMILDAIEQE